jgi:uncharacterized protein YndB with AHSA1/START domain
MMLAPVREEVIVAVPPERAFTIFTDEIGRWWPLAHFSVYGADASVTLSDGHIVERSADGRTAHWAAVTDWEPGAWLAFAWHPGSSGGTGSQVSVRFSSRENGTRVSVEHVGWEVYRDPEATRTGYEEGWPLVLAALAEHGVASAA